MQWSHSCRSRQKLRVGQSYPNAHARANGLAQWGWHFATSQGMLAAFWATGL